MKPSYDELSQHIDRLPRRWRMLLTVLVCVLMFWQGEHVGEALGKALYYLTHS